ncbi:hypothetical protein BGX38DRAFT_1209809 [Terfezia claveryi]|nr:hypothetical protein BGX38DRAFT_1209809 [Terfezia claveryi]
MPLASANPHTGTVGDIEKVEEMRVEVLCAGEAVVKEAVEALQRYVQYVPSQNTHTKKSLMKFTRWKIFE